MIIINNDDYVEKLKKIKELKQVITNLREKIGVALLLLLFCELRLMWSIEFCERRKLGPYIPQNLELRVYIEEAWRTDCNYHRVLINVCKAQPTKTLKLNLQD